MTRGRAARQAVRRHLSGVLSTHSKRFPGFPYGSATPHVIDAQGCPVILISELAEHTHNVLADDRVSYLIAESGTQLQTAARASLLGQAREIPREHIQARYLRYQPEGERSLGLGGFHFFRIEPRHVRFIEGFGGIHWIPGASYLAPPVALADAETDILDHMNADHVDAMRLYCRHVHGVQADAVCMIGIDTDGFDLRAGSAVLRFDFPESIATPGEARKALVELAQRARQ